MDNYHTAFGVYGILQEKQQLLVIRKNGGPYIHRYDLPGGSLEAGETLEQAFLREIQEESGLCPIRYYQLGTINFLYPWAYETTTMNNHICVFYQIEDWTGQLQKNVPQFTGQDALGAELIEMDNLTWDNASPLVMKAKSFVKNQQFSIKDERYSAWTVLEKNTFEN